MIQSEVIAFATSTKITEKANKLRYINGNFVENGMSGKVFDPPPALASSLRPPVSSHKEICRVG
jgi:hypothetical protein